MKLTEHTKYSYKTHNIKEMDSEMESIFYVLIKQQKTKQIVQKPQKKSQKICSLLSCVCGFLWKIS